MTLNDASYEKIQEHILSGEDLQKMGLTEDHVSNFTSEPWEVGAYPLLQHITLAARLKNRKALEVLTSIPMPRYKRFVDSCGSGDDWSYPDWARDMGSGDFKQYAESLTSSLCDAHPNSTYLPRAARPPCALKHS